MKKTLLSTVLLGSSLLAIDIGINLGKSHFDITQSNSENIILGANTPKSNGNILEVYAINDCKFTDDKDIKNYISLVQNRSGDIDNTLVLAGLVQELEGKEFKPYIGWLVGYGELKYNYNPLNSTATEDKKSSSMVAGLQAGAKYKIDDKLSLNINGKYLRAKYTTNLESSGTTGNIEHNALSSFSIGLIYSF